MRILTLLALVPSLALADTLLKNETLDAGVVKTLDCRGYGINCTRSGSTGVVTVFDADVTDAGVVTVSAQSFAGAKTFTGNVSVSDLTVSGNDITGSATGQTFNVVSGANDATTDASTAAVTIKSSVNVTDGDLVLNVENSAGDNLLVVNEQGRVTALTDVAASGNNFSCMGASATCQVDSPTDNATATGTVGAFTLKASENIADTDLILDVQTSTGAHALTLTEAGAVVAAGDVALAGGDLTSSHTTQSFNITSATSAATMTTTVAAITLAATGGAIDDLVVEVNDGSGNPLLSVDNQANLIVKGVTALSPSAVTISSGFGTSPSVTAGTASAFRLDVGTGGTASSGVVQILGAAVTGWNCFAADITTPATEDTVQTASTATTVTFSNYDRAAGTLAAWTASDILAISCFPY